MLFPIIRNYEKSGNGGGQRLETDEDWSSTDLIRMRVVAGGDRGGYLTK